MMALLLISMAPLEVQAYLFKRLNRIRLNQRVIVKLLCEEVSQVCAKSTQVFCLFANYVKASLTLTLGHSRDQRLLFET